MNERLVSTSKFLSLVLRHQPETIGLTLDAQGWADIDELIWLAGIASRNGAAGRHLTRTLIEEVVSTNDKKRFVISDDGRRIRASQGHSMAVDLGMTPLTPPVVLYHGTATRFLDSILRTGLDKRNRQHVHLSVDEATAVKVGQRHGKPAVLRVAAVAMHEAGHVFYRSENGVWLTERVPAEFIERSGMD